MLSLKLSELSTFSQVHKQYIWGEGEVVEPNIRVCFLYDPKYEYMFYKLMNYVFLTED